MAARLAVASRRLGIVDLNIVVAEPDQQSHPIPIVLVHGAWHGAWVWEERAIPGLTEAGHRIHAVDLRGHGSSPNPRSLRRTRIDHYVEDLAQVVASIPEPVVVVGHSMGGLVVQKYLETHDDVAGAVLLCPVPVGGAFGATVRTLRRHPIAFLLANLTLRLWPLVSDVGRAQHLFHRERIDSFADVKRIAVLADIYNMNSAKVFQYAGSVPDQDLHIATAVLGGREYLTQ